MGWATSDGAAHVLSCGYRGSYPPQLVLERLVSFEQHRLELVRAVQLAADHQEQVSNQFDWEAELLKRVSEQLNRRLSN